MAFFGVTKETIDKVFPHGNADRLEIATLVGKAFQFIVPKGEYNQGDDVLYFPIDSLIPHDVLARLGLVGKLAGAEQNRVKTIRLRGEISQGIVSKFETMAGLVSEDMTDEQLTERLGVTKYEPEPIPIQGGTLVRLPVGLSVYDIEGADRYADVAEQLMDEPVNITEKVEGSNFSVSYDSVLGTMSVNQRRNAILLDDGESHMFWDYALQSGLHDAIKDLGRATKQTWAAYGEFVGPGVQGNIYRLKEHRVYLFDVRRDGFWLTPNEFYEFVEDLQQKFGVNAVHAPVLSNGKTLREVLNGRTIQEISDGKSELADIRREGIVIKPMRNIYSPKLGSRLILKQRGPEYLAKSEL